MIARILEEVKGGELRAWGQVPVKNKTIPAGASVDVRECKYGNARIQWCTVAAWVKPEQLDPQPADQLTSWSEVKPKAQAVPA